MLHTRRALLCVALVAVTALSVTEQATAQDIPTGIWTGTIEPPNGQYIDATYNVRFESDSLKIRIIVPQMGEVEATEVRMEEGNLHFTWFPGAELTCVLKPRDEGRFRGACTDPDGDPGYLTMVPPKD